MGPIDVEQRVAAMEQRVAGVELRISELKDQMSAMEDRLGRHVSSVVDTRCAQLEATLTRRMVSVLGSWTILVGSTVGWLVVLFR